MFANSEGTESGTWIKSKQIMHRKTLSAIAKSQTKKEQQQKKKRKLGGRLNRYKQYICMK